MRRTEKLVELTRRDFCAIAGGCLGLAVTISGCTDGDSGAVGTGPLGDDGSGTGGEFDANPSDPDAAPGAPDARPKYDAKPSPTDAPTGPACTGTATDCGAPSAFAAGTPKMFSSGKFFIVRDAGGLYAVSSICTHEGATNGVSGGRFRCPRHGALFNFDGSIISGPVFFPLVHYAMCVLPNGNVGVTTGTQVDAATRLAV